MFVYDEALFDELLSDAIELSPSFVEEATVTVQRDVTRKRRRKDQSDAASKDTKAPKNSSDGQVDQAGSELCAASAEIFAEPHSLLTRTHMRSHHPLDRQGSPACAPQCHRAHTGPEEH